MNKPNADNVQHKPKILKYPDGLAPNTSSEVLKALFDRVVSDIGVSKTRWGKLVNAYIKKSAEESGLGNNFNLVEERSSLNKDLVTSMSMTWKKLCRGIDLLRAKRVRLGLTIEHANGSYTEHGLWFTVNSTLTADPDLDDDIPVPIEVDHDEDTDKILTQPTQRSLYVPPPNLRQYSGKYPKTDK